MHTSHAHHVMHKQCGAQHGFAELSAEPVKELRQRLRDAMHPEWSGLKRDEWRPLRKEPEENHDGDIDAGKVLLKVPPHRNAAASDSLGL